MTIPCTSGPLYQDSTCLIDGFGLILCAVLFVYLGILVPGCIYLYQRCMKGRFGSSYSSASLDAGLAAPRGIWFTSLQDNVVGVHYQKKEELGQEKPGEAGDQKEQTLRVYLVNGESYSVKYEK